MPIHSVFFDLDGTLTDPKEGITRGLAYALARRGILEDPENLCDFIGPPMHELLRRRYGFLAEEAAAAVADYRVYYGGGGIFQCRLYPGIPELLHNLKAAGLGVVLATSKPTVFAQQVLDHFGIAPYFDFVAGATLDESRVRKADVIAYALASLGEPGRADIVMVGDREHDVIGARAHGLPCVGALWGYGSREELTAAGARVLAESPSALEPILLSWPPAGDA